MDTRVSLGILLSVVISIAGAALSWGALDTRVSSLEAYRVKTEARQEADAGQMREILNRLTEIQTQLRIYIPYLENMRGQARR